MTLAECLHHHARATSANFGRIYWPILFWILDQWSSLFVTNNKVSQGLWATGWSCAYFFVLVLSNIVRVIWVKQLVIKFPMTRECYRFYWFFQWHIVQRALANTMLYIPYHIHCMSVTNGREPQSFIAPQRLTSPLPPVHIKFDSSQVACRCNFFYREDK